MKPFFVTSLQAAPAVQPHGLHNVLLAVDGSEYSAKAVQQVIGMRQDLRQPESMTVHLLNVQTPLTLHAARFASRRDRESFHRAAAEKALAPARALLEQHGVPHSVHFKTGERATVIAAEARRLRCQRIVLSTARKSSITRMIEDSTTNRVLEHTTVPVEVIAGDALPLLERWGVPAGLGAALTLLLMASD